MTTDLKIRPKRNPPLFSFFSFFLIFSSTLQAITIGDLIPVDLIGASLFVLYGLLFLDIKILPPVYPLLLLCLFSTVGILQSFFIIDFDIVRYFNHWVRLIVFALTFSFVFSSTHDNDHLLRKFLNSFMFVLFIHTLYGIYQFFALKDGMPFSDIRVEQAGSVFTRIIDDRYYYRIFSSFREPSNFGYFLSTSAFITCAFLAQNMRSRNISYFLSIISIIFFAFLCVYLTQSRAAFISIIGATGIAFVLHFKTLRSNSFIGVLSILAFSIAVFMLSFSLYDYISPALTGVGDVSIRIRWYVYNIFWENYDQIILGYGLGQFENIFYNINGVVWGPGSTYIYVASNTGLIGLFLYIMLPLRIYIIPKHLSAISFYIYSSVFCGFIYSFTLASFLGAYHWIYLALSYSMMHNWSWASRPKPRPSSYTAVTLGRSS